MFPHLDSYIDQNVSCRDLQYLCLPLLQCLFPLVNFCTLLVLLVVRTPSSPQSLSCLQPSSPSHRSCEPGSVDCRPSRQYTAGILPILNIDHTSGKTMARYARTIFICFNSTQIILLIFILYRRSLHCWKITNNYARTFKILLQTLLRENLVHLDWFNFVFDYRKMRQKLSKKSVW